MSKEKSIEAAKKLVEKYRSITIEDLQRCDNDIEELTGFGGTTSCTLCIAVKNNCNECIHPANDDPLEHPCCSGDAHKTYHEIEKQQYLSGNYEAMLTALRDRADYIESLIK